jgi:membrane associated rhomboid family serine protease
LRKLNSCPRCRAFFEVGETVCPQCGTSIVPKLVRERGGIFDRMGARGLSAVNLLVAANAILFIVAIAIQGGFAKNSGGLLGIGGVSGKTVIQLGGLTWKGVMLREEWWRLVCPMFLHFGILHILFNMMALRSIGPLVEKVFGPAKFLTMYLLAGLLGELASLWYHGTNMSVGAGASGAVLGVIGMALVFGFRSGNRDLTHAVLRWVVIIAIWGLAVPGIDNAGHLGGLAGGALVAFVVKDATFTRLKPFAVRFWDVTAVIGLLVVAVSFAAVAANQ